MKIVLYSGGLDSYIGLWLLRREDPDWTPAYFDLGLRYSQKERLHMVEVVGLHVFTDMLNLHGIEHGGVFVPQRNTLLCAAAQAIYDASEIALCSVADDIYADNTVDFHLRMSHVLSLTAGHRVRIFSPLVAADKTLDAHPLLTKAEAVQLYLERGGNREALERMVSCYHPTEISCGRCKACIRYREALEGVL